MEMLDRAVRPRGTQGRKLDVYVSFFDDFHHIVTYIYVELCARGCKAYTFRCKSCRRSWCDKENHDFDSTKAFQAFSEEYNHIKNKIDTTMLHNVCDLLFDFIDQPRPEESIKIVNELFNKTSDEVCFLHKELSCWESCREPHIKQFVEELCDRHMGYVEKLSRKLFLWFLEEYAISWRH